MAVFWNCIGLSGGPRVASRGIGTSTILRGDLHPPAGVGKVSTALFSQSGLDPGSRSPKIRARITDIDDTGPDGENTPPNALSCPSTDAFGGPRRGRIERSCHLSRKNANNTVTAIFHDSAKYGAHSRKWAWIGSLSYVL